jgi:hypothetical protein
LVDDMDVDDAATLLHAVGDLSDGQVGPDQLFVGGTPGGVFSEDVLEVAVDLGIFVDAPLPAAAGAPHAYSGLVRDVLEVSAPLPDRIGGDVEEMGDVLDASVPEFVGFDGGVLEIKIGAGGHLYVFVHPSSTGGVLLELVQDVPEGV